MKNLRVLKMLVVAFLLMGCFSSYAWFDAGHMVIAKIGYDELTSTEKEKIDSLIRVLETVDPDYSDFIRASTWMDGVKSTGLGFFNTYHYINQYYVVYPVREMPEFDECNVVWAINKAVKSLRSKWSSEFSRAMSLRFLIHTVGDVHQPMHATSRVSENTREGDRGGNLFPIDSIPYGSYRGKPGYLDNLHKLWDSGVTFFDTVNAQGYAENRKKIDKNVADVRNYIQSLSAAEKQKIEDRIRNVTEPSDWAVESYHLAIENAYQGIEEKGKTSEEYIERGQKVVKVQAYVAGKRLANLLRGILKEKDDR